MGQRRLARRAPTLAEPNAMLALAALGSEMIANVILYGLADRRLAAAKRPRAQVIDIYGSRRAAEKALCAVLSDEPSWAGDISVLELPLVAFPLGTPSLN